MNRTDTTGQFGVAPEKGWAREKILSVLMEKPATLSVIASEVGISKSTASYHMKELVNRAIAEIIDVRKVKGGVYSKTFALRRGVLVIGEPRPVGESADRMISEQYSALKMSWTANPQPGTIVVFLYHVLLSLHGASRQEIEHCFIRYGELFGREVVAPSLKSRGLARELREILEWLDRTGSALCSIEPGEKGTSVLSCSTFFRTTDPKAPVFKFLQGLVEGVLASKHGERYIVDGSYGGVEPAKVVVSRRTSPGKSQ